MAAEAVAEPVQEAPKGDYARPTIRQQFVMANSAAEKRKLSVC